MSELANKLRALCADECRNRIDYRCVVCRAVDAVEQLAAAEEAARWLFSMAEDHQSTTALSRWPQLFRKESE